MLLDLIRDYFVQYVFGGIDSNGNTFSGFIGLGVNEDGYLFNEPASVNDLYFRISNDGYYQYVSLGDWLSTTATIITLVIILVLCGLFIKKMVSTVAHLLGN